ncbi:hypothetical protein XENTR_v10022356 [Xenopus tropicalis]|nr:hypothetical protein XENTR_v10022356 [Xenopus tropicalis]
MAAIYVNYINLCVFPLQEKFIKDLIQPSCSWNDEPYYRINLIADESCPASLSTKESHPDVELVQELPTLVQPMTPRQTIYADFPSVSDTENKWNIAEILGDLFSSDNSSLFLCILLDLISLMYFWKGKPKDEEEATAENEAQNRIPKHVNLKRKKAIPKKRENRQTQRPKKKKLGFRVRKCFCRVPRKLKRKGKSKPKKNEFGQLFCKFISLCLEGDF